MNLRVDENTFSSKSNEIKFLSIDESRYLPYGNNKNKVTRCDGVKPTGLESIEIDWTYFPEITCDVLIMGPDISSSSIESTIILSKNGVSVENKDSRDLFSLSNTITEEINIGYVEFFNENPDLLEQDGELSISCNVDLVKNNNKLTSKSSEITNDERSEQIYYYAFTLFYKKE